MKNCSNPKFPITRWLAIQTPFTYSSLTLYNSRLVFNPEEQRPKGIVNIPPMTDKIYLDTGFTVV